MAVPLQVSFLGLSQSEPLMAAVRTAGARLDAVPRDVSLCRVTIEDRPPHPFERKRFNVRLEVRGAGFEVVVNREDDAAAEEALRRAFDAALRQLGAS